MTIKQAYQCYAVYAATRTASGQSSGKWFYGKTEQAALDAARRYMKGLEFEVYGSNVTVDFTRLLYRGGLYRNKINVDPHSSPLSR